jgi:signal recognition particle GTPase
LSGFGGPVLMVAISKTIPMTFIGLGQGV